MTAFVTVLDDYQRVALESADWSRVATHFAVNVISEHISDADELVERLERSDVVIAMRERTAFPATVLERLPRLRLLVTTGMGNAAIDLDAARELGILVCGTGGAGNGVPELTLGMMIALTRHFAEEDRSIREGGWQHTIGPGLAGRTLGIVGLGRQGIPVARLAQAFAMNVVAWSPHLTEERAAEHGVRAVTREELFSGSDIVTIHVPLTPATRGMIGTSDLTRMHPTSYLINTSRGPIVDEVALLDALRAGAIAGAALDVYDIEPLPLDHPLRSTPNTLLLPHLGYVTREAYDVFYSDAAEDIVAFVEGNPVRVLNA